MSEDRPTLLVICPVYRPDPAAVGQHVTDAAAELARRGHRVVVFTADRGYDDPTVRYPKREVLDGVEVRRLPWSSFGKSSIALRLLASISFVLQVLVRGAVLGRVDRILVTTATSLTPVAGLILSFLRRARLTFWVMDLNPDQLVALGVVRPDSLVARAFDAMNRAVLGRAGEVIVLDRFMGERVTAKLDVRRKLSVIPPWPLEDHLAPVPHDENPFRRRHGLVGKFVVMYSGNHGPSNPFETILRAAERLRDLPELVFVFIGGGVDKQAVERATGANVLSLPYQPLEELGHSLSAADVHLVTVGDAMPGIVHPCKVYGAMAVGRPILYLGPSRSHVADYLEEAEIGWRVEHGDVDAAERTIRAIVATSAVELSAKGERARQLVHARLGKDRLCGELCDVIERGRESHSASVSAQRPVSREAA